MMQRFKKILRMCKCPECFSGYFFLNCVIKPSVNLLSHIRSAMYPAFLMSWRMNKKAPALLPRPYNQIKLSVFSTTNF